VIAREQDLREGDGFEEVVARAGVLDSRGAVRLEELIEHAVGRFGPATGVPADGLRSRFAEEFRTGFVPVSRIAAIPHLRVTELERPALVIVRCAGGIRLLDCEEAADRLADICVVLFLLSPERGPGRHLRLLGHLATRVEEPGFEQRWWAAEGESALKATLLSGARMVRLLVVPGLATGTWIGEPLQRIRLPAGALVAVVHRRGQDIVPHGGTVIEAGDWLSVIGEGDALRALESGYPRRSPSALATR
jgi:mannitol/fructose-specific phosphotransferase system IIA component (Ntr-type)